MSKKKRGSADEKFKTGGGRYRSVLILFAGDVVFTSLAFLSAHFIMFFQVPMPPGYEAHQIAIGAISVAVVLALLLFFDSYNTVWKYAGRVEFFKFIMAYICAFVVLFVFKHIMKLKSEKLLGVLASTPNGCQAKEEDCCGPS